MNISAPSLQLIFALLISSLLSACDSSPKAEKTFSFKKEGLYSASLSENYALIAPLAGSAELWQLKPTKLMHKWQHTDEKMALSPRPFQPMSNTPSPRKETPLPGDASAMGFYYRSGPYPIFTVSIYPKMDNMH